ncbi:hypothetical protein OCEANICA350_12785 [Oceanicaulis sp. 350]|nr:hypothetical protein OCEANICA350_12785 [Oceanicaulis sp. 350]
MEGDVRSHGVDESLAANVGAEVETRDLSLSSAPLPVGISVALTGSLQKTHLPITWSGGCRQAWPPLFKVHIWH